MCPKNTFLRVENEFLHIAVEAPKVKVFTFNMIKINLLRQMLVTMACPACGWVGGEGHNISFGRAWPVNAPHDTDPGMGSLFEQIKPPRSANHRCSLIYFD